MKLPVIIQHHPDGYVCEIPQEDWDEMKKNSTPISRDELFDRIANKAKESISDGIPEKWRKPVKKYSGMVYGVYGGLGTISGEADSIPELLKQLTKKATEMERGLDASASKDWPSVYSIEHIEI